MVKTPIKVIIRSRPTVDFAYKNIQIDENSGHVAINIPKSPDQGRHHYMYIFRVCESLARKLGVSF